MAMFVVGIYDVPGGCVVYMRSEMIKDAQWSSCGTLVAPNSESGGSERGCKMLLAAGESYICESSLAKWKVTQCIVCISVVGVGGKGAGGEARGVCRLWRAETMCAMDVNRNANH